MIDSGATRNCIGCQPWMGLRQKYTAEHCYYVGNAGRHDRSLLRRYGTRYESDSNESSDSYSSMPELIPRVVTDDSSSDKESDWMSTTEELTDD